MKRAIVVLSMLAVAGSVFAGGVNSIPYSNDFEQLPVGTLLTNETGWSVAYEAKRAVITNVSDNWVRSPYFAGSTHTNALFIDGVAATNSLTPLGATAGDPPVFVDFSVKPTYAYRAPTFDPNPDLREDLIAYINTNGHLVFLHTYFDKDYAEPGSDGYRPAWTTNTSYYFSTNCWTRLTFAVDYLDGSSWGDSYYRIAINGSYVSNSLGYQYLGQLVDFAAADPDPPNNIPLPPGGEWFMCANLPHYSGDPQGGLSSFCVVGDLMLDDFAISTNAPDDMLQVRVDDTAVVEGNSGMTALMFTVSLSAVQGSDVTVDYATADGTATADYDYLATNGTLTIAAGAVSTTITVQVYGDTSLEGVSEHFVVYFSGQSAGSLAKACVLGVIVDDDAVPPPQYTANQTPYTWLDLYDLVSGGDYAAADLADKDNDGMLNWEEYWAGTIPTNAASIFRIIASTKNYEITWLGGTNEQNYPFLIYRSTNLTEANTWTLLPFTNYPRNGANFGTNVWADPDGAMFGPRVFYMITAPTNAP